MQAGSGRGEERPEACRQGRGGGRGEMNRFFCAIEYFPSLPECSGAGGPGGEGGVKGTFLFYGGVFPIALPPPRHPWFYSGWRPGREGERGGDKQVFFCATE